MKLLFVVLLFAVAILAREGPALPKSWQSAINMTISDMDIQGTFYYNWDLKDTRMDLNWEQKGVRIFQYIFDNFGDKKEWQITSYWGHTSCTYDDLEGSPMSPDFLKDATYAGPMEVRGIPAYKWVASEYNVWTAQQDDRLLRIENVEVGQTIDFVGFHQKDLYPPTFDHTSVLYHAKCVPA